MRTENTQPAILRGSPLRVLKDKGPACDVVAGHSLGEWTAPSQPGHSSCAMRWLTHLRGQFMQEAVPVGQGAMAALMGLDLAGTRALCAEASAPGEPVEPANLNGGGQIVISGHAAAVDRAIAQAKGKGAKRAVKLAVSAPFHCSLMKPAAERLAAALDDVAIAAPSAPVVSNVEATANRDGQRIKALLVAQVTATVRWEGVDPGDRSASSPPTAGSGSVLRA
jgi:[acyl-carrier-protein] S-malonyltransferase